MAIPIFGDIIDAVKDVVSEVVVDKDKKNEINLELQKLSDAAEARIHQEILAQVELNKVEAASGSLFVAGWRPFVGWVGGFGLAYSTILQPLSSWIAMVAGYAGGFPSIDNQLLLYVLGGMLGLGAQRTYEKVKGVSTNDFRDVPAGKKSPAPEPEKVAPPEATAPPTEKGPAGKPKKRHFKF